MTDIDPNCMYELECPICRESKVGALFRLFFKDQTICHAECGPETDYTKSLSVQWDWIPSHMRGSEIDNFKRKHPKVAIHVGKLIDDPSWPDPPNLHRCR